MTISCAQKVGTENPRVPSSILGPATIFFALIRGGDGLIVDSKTGRR